jgi:predicted RNase H-like HicB family nuclease
MKNYIALFEHQKNMEGFSVIFPDFPGLYSGGDDYEEAYSMAHKALAFHIETMKNDDEEIPIPKTLEQIKKTWKEWQEWEKNYNFMIVPISLVPSNEKSKRINIMIPEGLLAHIDAIAANRSEFISKAVEKILKTH